MQLNVLKYNKKRSLAKNFDKEYKLSAVDLQPSTDKTLNANWRNIYRKGKIKVTKRTE